MASVKIPVTAILMAVLSFSEASAVCVDFDGGGRCIETGPARNVPMPAGPELVGQVAPTRLDDHPVVDARVFVEKERYSDVYLDIVSAGGKAAASTLSLSLVDEAGKRTLKLSGKDAGYDELLTLGKGGVERPQTTAGKVVALGDYALTKAPAWSIAARSLRRRPVSWSREQGGAPAATYPQKKRRQMTRRGKPGGGEEASPLPHPAASALQLRFTLDVAGRFGLFCAASVHN